VNKATCGVILAQSFERGFLSEVVRHVKAKSLWASILVTLGLTPSTVGAQAIKVEPSVRVSPLASGGHFWGMGNTHAAPDDPQSLITCGIRERQEPLSWEGYLYLSSDGGATWREGRIDATLSDDNVPNLVSETSCAIGRSGKMYMNTSVWGKYYSQPFQLSHSKDGGHTWSKPLQKRGWYDATRSVVDNSGGRYDGRLYIFSSRLERGPIADFNGQYQPLLMSRDEGNSVSPAIAARSDDRYIDEGWPSQAVVLSNGTVLAVYRAHYASLVKGEGAADEESPDLYGVEVVASADGGRTIHAPVALSRWERNEHLSEEYREEWGIADLVTAIAVDHSSRMFGGRVYVAWREANTAAPTSRIMLAWSEDSGKTWTKPLRVDDAPRLPPGMANVDPCRGVDPTTPSLAVNGDGTIGIMWMERSPAPTWRFSASTDGGATFLPSAAIYTTKADEGRFHTQWFNPYMTASDHPTEWRNGFKRQDGRLGFTLFTQASNVGSLVATTDGIFHALWTTRDDGALWTARIGVDIERSARPALSILGLKDISSRVRLEARNFRYDEASSLLTVDVVLINTSSGVQERMPRFDLAEKNGKGSGLPSSVEAGVSLTPPVIMRLTSMYSEVGHLELVNVDGIDASGSPLLDWSTSLPAETLSPGTRSASRRLQFRLSDLKPGSDPNILRVVDVAAEVYSR
jgi:hypothetical protein